MSDDPDRRVRWHDTGRGSRVEIDIGGESVVTTPDHARGLRDDLSAVLEEIEALRCTELPHYLKGYLPAQRHADFEKHLERCAQCQAGVHVNDPTCAARVRQVVRTVFAQVSDLSGAEFAQRHIEDIATRVASQLTSPEHHDARSEIARLRSQLDTATAARAIAESRSNNLDASHAARDATKLRIATRLGLSAYATQGEIADAVDAVVAEREGLKSGISDLAAALDAMPLGGLRGAAPWVVQLVKAALNMCPTAAATHAGWDPSKETP